MKKMMRVLTIFIVLLFCTSLAAQYTIEGRVLEASSNTPLGYASVVVKSTVDSTLVQGVTTEEGGFFKLTVPSKEVFLELSFIGFDVKIIDDISFDNKRATLGDILLGESSQLLDEIEVTAEKSTTEFKLDKRVFNVGADLSSTGASALEVLNNVPSVNVSIEGDISLRGASGVQILINGKPSVLADESSNALGTITADMIEKVEVITNPSAKYEAEGTAGIINIVLKKDEKKGLNGSISLNTGLPHNHSIGFSMNNRTNKFNLFTQGGVGYRELPTNTENINRDFINNTEISSIGKEFRNENFYNIILGTDYYINPNNIITLSGSFAYEIEDQPSETSFISTKDGLTLSEWTRTEMTEATNPKLQYELQYKRDFDDHKEHQLLFSAIGNYFGKDQSSEFSNVFTTGTNNQPNQRTATNFEEGKYTFNLDYTKPFREYWTIEVGGQYLTNDVNNDFEVSNINLDGEYVIDDALTNVFEYSQNVLGVYTTGAYEGDIWGIKLGLRVENTDLKTLLVNTDERNSQNFTNFFPTLHTSYKISDNISFQAGYSKRIFRPRLWDLNPFFNIRNNFNVRAGNPNLLPEFTDSYEAGVIFIFDKISFNTNIYYRYTTDKIERVSIFEDGVTVWTPQNIGVNKAPGIEANFKYSPIKKIVISGDANYNVFVREGIFNDQNFDFTADQWFGKVTTKYKISKALDTELTLRYESEEQTIQGVVADNLFADFGLKYKILGGKGVFNFSVRDLFASRIRQNTITQTNFYTYSFRQRGRFIRLGFSYSFGKGEAMQYSGRRR